MSSSDDEEYSAEARGIAAAERIKPSASQVEHLIVKRLKKADERSTRVDTTLCRQVSFNAKPRDVLDWAVWQIDKGRLEGSSSLCVPRRF